MIDHQEIEMTIMKRKRNGEDRDRKIKKNRKNLSCHKE